MSKATDRAQEAYWLGLATGVLHKYGFKAEAEWLLELYGKISDTWSREDKEDGQS